VLQAGDVWMQENIGDPGGLYGMAGDFVGGPELLRRVDGGGVYMGRRRRLYRPLMLGCVMRERGALAGSASIPWGPRAGLAP